VTGVPIRLVVADDHALVLAGICGLLQSEPDFQVVGTATTGAQALAVAQRVKPDVVLLDVAMPDRSGLEVLPELVALPGVVVLLLTGAVDDLQRELAFRLGARGIVLKDWAIEQLFSGVRSVVRGEYWLWQRAATAGDAGAGPAARAEPKPARTLTARERQVLKLVVEGYLNREVADALGISEDTVKHHVTSLFDKTGASSRVELAMFAVHHRLLDSD
jgi:two-component system, NarL family, nitrate/nitrite response regulator NarL